MTVQTQQLETYLQEAPAYTPRMENHLNRRHIIVPVIMMVPGVHNGSRGPLFHSEEELKASAERWNGYPVTISHPTDADGNFVSAFSNGMSARIVGTVHNARFEAGKLRADVWLDEQRLIACSAEAAAAIQSGRPLDVSIGVFTDEEEQSGVWNGEPYTGIAHNHRPDHLALLPGEQGACSWADGCGVRVNATNENNQVSTNMKGGSNVMTEEKDILATIKQLSTEGFAVNMITNATGFQETMRSLQQKLDSMDSETKIHYLQEVYDDHVIYEIGIRNSNGTVDRTLYRQGYEVQDNGAIELTGNPVEVRRKVEYVTLMERTKFNSNNVKPKNGGQEMAENTPSPCLVAKVDALINNSATRFAEADRDWLLTQSEDVLAKLIPIDQVPPKAPEVNAERALAVLKESFKKPEEFLAVLPDDLKTQVEEGLKLYAVNREELVKTIKEASKEWTDEELGEMSVNMLNKIVRTIKPIADYSVNGGTGGGEHASEEVMLPAGIETKK